jgi:hypothetical protein
MKLILILCLTIGSANGALKWSGLRIPPKVSAEDGVTNLSRKIGVFTNLTTEQAAHGVFNVQNRFQSSKPWVTLAVGKLPDAADVSVSARHMLIERLNQLGVDVFLEIYPRKTNDVYGAIDLWLGEFKKHPNIKGLGIDLEYYKKVDDATAEAWEKKIKAYDSRYRMHLKHWDEAFMPPTFRGDIIFINTSSEATVAALNDEFVKWAAHFSPAACAFQIGYPADEDGMDGKRSGGWWRLQDPIKNWGDQLLAKIANTNQEIGIIWVQVKSGKTYNAFWDLTEGATLTRVPAGSSNVVSASAPPLPSAPPLKTLRVLFDGKNFDGWEYNPNAWSIVGGAMRGTGRGGNIFTKDDYGSFRIIFKSRVASPEGNQGRDHLGVLFWGERTTNYSTGKALQVQPPHGAMWDYRANKGLKPEHPNPRPRPRYQDWHTCEALANIETGEVLAAVDGMQVTQYKHDPALIKRGPIGMQIHAPQGIFDHKDIWIESDPAEKRLVTLKE